MPAIFLVAYCHRVSSRRGMLLLLLSNVEPNGLLPTSQRSRSSGSRFNCRPEDVDDWNTCGRENICLVFWWWYSVDLWQKSLKIFNQNGSTEMEDTKSMTIHTLTALSHLWWSKISEIQSVGACVDVLNLGMNWPFTCGWVWTVPVVRVDTVGLRALGRAWAGVYVEICGLMFDLGDPNEWDGTG